MKGTTVLDELSREGGKLDMSPMIDMVFLLLIFFLVNANMITSEVDQAVQVSVADNSNKQEKKKGRIVIDIHESGQITAEGNELVGEVQIQQYIQSRREQILAHGELPKLHIRGDRRGFFAESRQVIKSASRVGVSHVSFATESSNK